MTPTGPARMAAGLSMAVLLLTTACGGDAPAEPEPPVPDMHTFARPHEARVTHVVLDLRADFAERRLSGTASLDLVVASGAEQVVLDTRDLDIVSVADRLGRPLAFEAGTADAVLGTPLTVRLPSGVTSIVVRYRTSPDAAALQWLEPSQTAGKRHPYLYSQGQAILTRTWIPTQDSPGIRQTYAATITVPEPLTAVMSAESVTPDGRAVDGGRAFEFRMPQPIPPYLMAIAVGELAFRPIGRRSGVYAEPSVVEGAAAEFADLERMMEAAEALGGPYRWDRYDVLVLPPSFPFGGMENPRLTFVTPTILAGDRSLTSLIAHELAHSWSGNLVTNATWSDFWLNEGFTTYFENRIMEQLYGRERALMLEQLGRRELADEIARLGADSPDTKLHLDLTGRNPDDGVTAIAYDKGAAFLRMLEAAVGRERFDVWLRGYFDRHAFTSLTTDGFLQDFRAHLAAGDADLERRVRLDEWIFGTGLPSNATVPASDAFTAVDAQVAAFTGGARAASLRTADWTPQQWQHFLGALPRSLTAAQLAEMDRAFGFTASGNSEVLFAWLRLAIQNRYEPAMPALDRFLTGQGRRKFLKPLYEDLMAAAPWGPPLARQVYARARSGYHAVSTQTIDRIVN